MEQEFTTSNLCEECHMYVFTGEHAAHLARHRAVSAPPPHVCDGCPCSVCGHGVGGGDDVCKGRSNVTISSDGMIQPRNGAGIERSKLRQSPGRPKGARNLNAKHPSSISKAFAKAGLDWKVDFALAIKANNRARIKLWLRLLPYLVTTTNRTKVRKWRGKASKAALIALDALEGK